MSVLMRRCVYVLLDINQMDPPRTLNSYIPPVIWARNGAIEKLYRPKKPGAVYEFKAYEYSLNLSRYDFVYSPGFFDY